MNAVCSSTLVALLVTGCTTSSQTHVVERLPQAPDDSLTYFDPALLKTTRTRQTGDEAVEISELSYTEKLWYPKHWIVAEEPSYWQLSVDQNFSEEQFVRLTILPTFSAPQIYTIRILDDGSGVWTFKQTNGKGGYGAGHRYSSSQKRSSENENSLFMRRLRRIGAFDQPYGCGPNPNTVMLDGTKIVFEFSQYGRYGFTRCGLKSEEFSAMLKSVFTDAFEDLGSLG